MFGSMHIGVIYVNYFTLESVFLVAVGLVALGGGLEGTVDDLSLPVSDAESFSSDVLGALF